MISNLALFSPVFRKYGAAVKGLNTLKQKSLLVLANDGLLQKPTGENTQPPLL